MKGFSGETLSKAMLDPGCKKMFAVKHGWHAI